MVYQLRVQSVQNRLDNHIYVDYFHSICSFSYFAYVFYVVARKTETQVGVKTHCIVRPRSVMFIFL